MIDKFDIKKAAQDVFDTEIAALEKTKNVINEDFINVAKQIVSCRGKVILSGVGKSGHIARKISATLASLGTPSFYMHPGEALHGDLGMVRAEDMVFLLSFSGESTEVTSLLPVLQEIGCTTVAVTGNVRSNLYRGCEYHLLLPPMDEACYMHLAPTSSTTSFLVLGDALAVVTSRMRNYTKEDFGLYHPAGSLGKRLLVHVKDLMFSGEANAVVVTGSSLRQSIVEMSTKGLNMLTVTDQQGNLRGIITDGDLRRMLERGVDVYHETIDTVMTTKPKYIFEHEMAVNALQQMSDANITTMPVINDDHKVVGTIRMQDIFKAGIIR